jgi:hypothetical protein
MNSYAIKKKDEIKRVAKANRWDWTHSPGQVVKGSWYQLNYVMRILVELNRIRKPKIYLTQVCWN